MAPWTLWEHAGTPTLQGHPMCLLESPDTLYSPPLPLQLKCCILHISSLFEVNGFENTMPAPETTRNTLGCCKNWMGSTELGNRGEAGENQRVSILKSCCRAGPVPPESSLLWPIARLRTLPGLLCSLCWSFQDSFQGCQGPDTTGITQLNLA